MYVSSSPCSKSVASSIPCVYWKSLFLPTTFVAKESFNEHKNKHQTVYYTVPSPILFMFEVWTIF